MYAVAILGVWLFGSLCFGAGWAVGRRLQDQALAARRPDPGNGLWGDEAWREELMDDVERPAAAASAAPAEGGHVTPRDIAEAVLDKLRDVELLIEQLSEDEVYEFFQDLYDLDPEGVPEDQLESYLERERNKRDHWREAFDAEMDRAHEAVLRAKRCAEEAMLAACWQPLER